LVLRLSFSWDDLGGARPARANIAWRDSLRRAAEGVAAVSRARQALGKVLISRHCTEYEVGITILAGGAWDFFDGDGFFERRPARNVGRAA
jgi:hypothetical protein